MRKDLLIYYTGFKHLPSVDLSKINPIKLEKLKQNLGNFKDKVVLLQGDLAVFVNVLLEQVPPSEFRGYYFPELFEQLLNSEIQLFDLNFPKFVCFYSIGKELAKDKTYSGVVLTNLVDKAKKEGATVFLEGVNKSTLQNEYKVDFPVETLNVNTIKS
jgi:hypothetical protein